MQAKHNDAAWPGCPWLNRPHQDAPNSRSDEQRRGQGRHDAGARGRERNRHAAWQQPRRVLACSHRTSPRATAQQTCKWGQTGGRGDAEHAREPEHRCRDRWSPGLQHTGRRRQAAARPRMPGNALLLGARRRWCCRGDTRHTSDDTCLHACRPRHRPPRQGGEARRIRLDAVCNRSMGSAAPPPLPGRHCPSRLPGASSKPAIQAIQRAPRRGRYSAGGTS